VEEGHVSNRCTVFPLGARHSKRANAKSAAFASRHRQIGSHFPLTVRSISAPGGFSLPSCGPLLPDLTQALTATTKVYEIDRDIDSLNDNGYAAEGYDAAEDRIEASEKEENGVMKPGKVVVSGINADTDADGTPDYADLTIPGGKFVPVQVTLKKPFDPEKAYVRFDYTESKPEESEEGWTVSGAGTSEDPEIYTLHTGGMRLWKKDAPSRSAADFVPPDEDLPWTSIADGNSRTKILHLEYVDKETPEAAGRRDIGITATEDDAECEDKVVATLLPVEVGVDADRDGEITFDQKDKTTAEKPFRFWINDDRDIGHTVDSVPPPFGHNGDWEEDDVNSDEQANPDCDVAGLKFRRDLEDLTRIWIDFAGINSVFPSSDSTVALKVRIDADSGTPKVNLFQPVESDGGREFLKDEATGYNQLQGIYGQELCKVTGSSSVEVPRRAWETLPSDKVVHLLFEGAKEGDGKLIFELWKDGAKVCDLPPVILRLRKANDFYETWTVGDVTSPEITDDNNNYSVWPASIATMQPNTGRDLTTPEKPEEKDYIMFVHGWNMTPDDKTQFADTMFKRLWHQGF
jgi:hypothetical protein